MVSAVSSATEERTGMKKKEFLTVNELLTEWRMSLNSIQRTYRNGKISNISLIALSLLHLDT